MYHYDDSEVDRSQDNLTVVNLLNERVHEIAYKIKAALADLLYKAMYISNSKSELYGDIMNSDVKVLMYSLPTKLLMNSSKLFGDSIRGNVHQDTILDLISYALHTYRMFNDTNCNDLLYSMIQKIYTIVDQRHYEYNGADLIYDRLSMADIASMIHIKAIRIKNLLNSLGKINDSAYDELVKSRVFDNIYDVMIYAVMLFLKLHRV
jgi:hypothetical protein